MPLLTYTVTYNANGATGGTIPASQLKTQGVDLTLATNSGSLVKTGSSFAGSLPFFFSCGAMTALSRRYRGRSDTQLTGVHAPADV